MIGIEFVVVAARAVDRDAHRRGDDLRDHVVEIAGAGGALEHVALRLHLAHEIPRPGGEKTRGDDRLRVIRRKHIARDLLAEKLVVRLVGIQRLDDVIAIAPGVRPQLVALKAVRVRVVRDVQPVPRPALAVMRRATASHPPAFHRPPGRCRARTAPRAPASAASRASRN